jgi:hypothetical protein
LNKETIHIDLTQGQGIVNISFGVSKELLDKQFDVVYNVVMQILKDYRDGKRVYFPPTKEN